MGGRALLVDDDAERASLLRAYLAQHGFAVTHATSARAATDLAEGAHFEVALVIGATTKRWHARLRALGVRDIVTVGNLDAPSPGNVLMRVRDQMRERSERAMRPTATAGELTLEASTSTARVGDHTIDFTVVEFEILWFLAREAGAVRTRDHIAEALARGGHTVQPSAITVHVCRVRAKLRRIPQARARVRTVRREGYRLEGVPRDAAPAVTDPRVTTDG